MRQINYLKENGKGDKVKDNNYCIYIHRNIINNKAYIGITKYGDTPNERWRNGNGYLVKNKKGEYIQPHFAYAILKYGWDNFEHIIWANNLLEDDAKKMEIMLIALFNTTDSNYGYNISLGGESFSMTDVNIVKRTDASLETKNKNRIQESIIMFKDRFDNGDKNILQCQKCGAYFEKEKNQIKKNNKRDASKRQNSRMKRKYCDYCAKYHKRTKKIVICADCGKEFVVKSKNTQTCRCEKCKQIKIRQNKIKK